MRDISSYKTAFEHYRASIRHLVCTNVLVYVRTCVFACVRYRSVENICLHKCIYTRVCFVFCACKQVCINCL